MIELPKIGSTCYGGIFAGIARGRDGGPDYMLIAGESSATWLAWPDAVQWAEALDTGGYADWRLPTRAEQALMFVDVPELFKPELYWSGEQYAGDKPYAWYQDFGYQNYKHKTLELRARAVRRQEVPE